MITADQILEAFKARSWRIATAESCTGGLVSAALTEVPGSSAAFERGFVTYTNLAKQEMLNVTAASLDAFGAVSEEVAREMALGALHFSDAEVAVSVTGIAGPGGSEFKPEGRVCFGLAGPKGAILTEVMEFGAIGRSNVRTKSVQKCLHLLNHASIHF